jgi:HAD superfamily hydrolase (TIGR01509 family)
MHCCATFHKCDPVPVRALIFDMDGTILDTRAYHMAAWREFVKRLGLTYAHYRVAETGFGKTNWAIFDTWFGPNRNGHDYNALSEQKEAIFRELIQGKEKPRPGMLDLLGWARRHGVKVALATSGPEVNAKFLLEDSGIARYFDTVIWGSDRIRSKPHSEPFINAAWRLGVPPQQSVVFEDSSHGFWAAVRAGMRLIGIAECPEDMMKVRNWTPYVYQDFRGIPELLERWV